MITGVFLFLYYVTYSEGVRSGELIKFSRKGVIFKTWEGEISQGISGAQIFKFSVLDRDQEVIESLKEAEGQYVKVNYEERFTTFAWWGETKYFITSVEVTDSPHRSKFGGSSP
ncbi:MAG: 6-phosphogluconate dehydrogenase [Robiginitalea sp.]